MTRAQSLPASGVSPTELPPSCEESMNLVGPCGTWVMLWRRHGDEQSFPANVQAQRGTLQC